MPGPIQHESVISNKTVHMISLQRMIDISVNTYGDDMIQVSTKSQEAGLFRNVAVI